MFCPPHHAFYVTALHLSVMYPDVPRPECSFDDVTWTPFSCTPPSCRRDTEFKLEEALRATDEERERGVSVEAETSRLREEMKQADQSWQRFVFISSRRNCEQWPPSARYDARGVTTYGLYHEGGGGAADAASCARQVQHRHDPVVVV